MKLTCYVPSCQVLTKEVVEGKPKSDGTVTTYYRLGIKHDGHIGEVNCDLSVFQSVIEDKFYDFRFSFNTDYEKIWVRFDAFMESSTPSGKKS